MEQLEQSVNISSEAQTSFQTENKIISIDSEKNVLFAPYPALREKISYVGFAAVPTPVQSCKKLASALHLSVAIWIKQDGLSGAMVGDKQLFGGNKVRKLQYLLADALAHDATDVLTFGCAGSNHVLQTAIYAQQVGLSCVGMLKPQANSQVVRRNLLLHQLCKTELHYSPDLILHTVATIAVCLRKKHKKGKYPYIIPVGGSCGLGALGYVEAAFELKNQIQNKELPCPDHIYVTLGSGGTAAGLLLGLQAAGIPALVHLVLDEPEDFSGKLEEKVKKLFLEANELLHAADVTFPLFTLTGKEYVVVNSQTGPEYGVFTPECAHAIDLMKEQEHIALDGTYTGKCCAAMLDDIQQQRVSGTVLFWNTFCGDDFHEKLAQVDYHRLPRALWSYFIQDVQPLDR